MRISLPRFSRWIPVAALAATLFPLSEVVAQGGPGATAPAQPAALPFTLTAEVRVRSELDGRTGDSLLDAATLLRTRIGVRVPVSPHARLFAQVQDARAFGEEEAGTTDASAAQLDLHQGNLELSDSLGGRPWMARGAAGDGPRRRAAGGVVGVDQRRGALSTRCACRPGR